MISNLAAVLQFKSKKQACVLMQKMNYSGTFLLMPMYCIYHRWKE